MPCIDDLFGTVEGSTGPMGSGKTNEFIHRIKRLKRFEKSNGYKVLVAKPVVDNRILSDIPPEDPTRIIDSRDGMRITGVIPLSSSKDLYRIVDEAKDRYGRIVLALSEIQFLDSGVVDFIGKKGPDVYLLWEGLVSSFRGEWFELRDFRATMQDVAKLTSSIETKRAICEYPGCMRHADFTQRLQPDGEPDHWSSELVVVGERQYQARCDEHHVVPGREEAKFLVYPINRMGPAGIPLASLESIGHNAGIPDEETKSIISALEREYKIRISEGIIYPAD